MRAAIVGAAGYTGAELTRILAGHPSFELSLVTSSSEAGRAVSDLYPGLAGVGLSYVEHDAAAVADAADVAFLAVPHTAAMGIAGDLLERGLTVIDLSADFRLDEVSVYEAWYGVEHTAPELVSRSVYGLPELDRSALPGATLVACPGCYPTASLLAATPALSAGVAAGRVVIDAKSGVSGAGRKANETTHYCSADESIQPYAVGTHRHTPEIAAGLAAATGEDITLTFTPHLAPMKRGILATTYMEAADGLTSQDAVGVYEAAYRDEPFVTVHPAGRMPATGEVSGSNRAHLGCTVDAAGTLIVACTIDNLIKGSSGQAVQCANLVFGLPETAGLDHPVPVV